MAYNKDDLIKKSLAAIKKHDLMFIDYICAFIGISRQTFYEKELDKIDSIKKALEENRIKAKTKMLKKWDESANPVLQVARYKLVCDDDERKKLSQSYHDLTTGGKEIKININVPDKKTAEIYNKLIDKLQNNGTDKDNGGHQ